MGQWVIFKRNALALVPKGGVPSKVVVGPHMQVINEGIRRLEETLANLVRSDHVPSTLSNKKLLCRTSS